jgi:hypothetical protein
MAFRLKEVQSWTSGENGDVLAFLQTILPGHTSLTYFKYTTGAVLGSLTKDDLRRQSKDEEFANIVWHELQAHRKSIADKREIDEVQPAAFTLFVRTPADVAVELDVLPSETVWSVKCRLADVEGTPAEQQRLIWNGFNMDDTKSLAMLRVQNGAVVLLVPRMTNQIRSIPPTTARGMLMVPGNRAWQPSHSIRPWMPLVANDVYRPFPMNVEFDSADHYANFMHVVLEGRDAAHTAERPVLEIVPADGTKAPVQTLIDVDPENTEVLRVDTVGDILVPNGRYKSVLRIPEKGGRAASSMMLTITCGARIA